MIWLRSTGLRLLLAIGLGFALWIFVSYTQNPDRRISFDSVPVKIEGLQPDLVVVDENGLPRTTLRPVSVTVEAEKDDITAVGQTSAAHALCTGLPAKRRQQYVQPGAGHYGVFSGRRWREQIAPRIAEFIRNHG